MSPPRLTSANAWSPYYLSLRALSGLTARLGYVEGHHRSNSSSASGHIRQPLGHRPYSMCPVPPSRIPDAEAGSLSRARKPRMARAAS